MRTLQVINETRQTSLGEQVRVASTWKSRAIGLLATPALAPGEGLWIRPCSSIHTFFMRYPIDVLFISAQGQVLHQATLAPWRVSRWVRRSDGVLELPAGTLESSQTCVGDQIIMKGLPASRQGGN